MTSEFSMDTPNSALRIACGRHYRKIGCWTTATPQKTRSSLTIELLFRFTTGNEFAHHSPVFSFLKITLITVTASSTSPKKDFLHLKTRAIAESANQLLRIYFKSRTERDTSAGKSPYSLLDNRELL